MQDLKKNFRISSNSMFICLGIMGKIIITSIELAIPIVSLDINNGIIFIFIFFQAKNVY
jgi:hypothetical protein